MNRIFLICTIALLPSAITSACITPTPTCPIQPWGEFSITPATSWQAGVDSINEWYGADYKDMGDFASLTYIGKGTNLCQMRLDQRSLLCAVNTVAGTYQMEFETRFDNYAKQFNYWQVYLVEDNARISLVGNPKWNTGKTNTARVAYGFAKPQDDDGLWHDYSIDFNLTPCQAKKYDYVVFVFTGSRRACEVLDYGRFELKSPAGCVPEPSTLLLCGSGAMFLFGIAGKKR